jgi:hypothetical protein
VQGVVARWSSALQSLAHRVKDMLVVEVAWVRELGQAWRFCGLSRSLEIVTLPEVLVQESRAGALVAPVLGWEVPAVVVLARLAFGAVEAAGPADADDEMTVVAAAELGADVEKQAARPDVDEALVDN